MNLRFSEEEQDFRRRARVWLAKNVPSSPRPPPSLAAAQYDRDWQRKLFEHGWAGVNWPKEYGGLGLSGLQQVIWYEELVRARAPYYINTTYVGLMHAGPTLIARGSDEQKRSHLSDILSGRALWCQGFSEPNAGSDLASLITRGEVTDDHVIISGSKMWTSDAQYADFQELLVRTDCASQRHKGLTWLVCDMRSDNIEIKPIKTMMGDEHVNMVFYNDVKVPIANVVGGMGNGWSVAMSTLSFERGLGFVGDQLALYDRVERAISLASKTRLDDGTLAIDDHGIRERLASIKADTLAIRAMTLSHISDTERTGVPGPKGSLMKLMVTKTHKALCDIVREFLGLEFLEFTPDRASHPWTYDYLWSWVFTISGGTSEIQREIIADQVLQLPRAR